MLRNSITNKQKLYKKYKKYTKNQNFHPPPLRLLPPPHLQQFCKKPPKYIFQPPSIWYYMLQNNVISDYEWLIGPS